MSQMTTAAETTAKLLYGNDGAVCAACIRPYHVNSGRAEMGVWLCRPCLAEAMTDFVTNGYARGENSFFEYYHRYIKEKQAALNSSWPTWDGVCHD